MKTMLMAVRESDVETKSAIKSVKSPNPVERLAAASRDDIKQLETGLTAHILELAVDHKAAPVALKLSGRVVMARPLDTRRFVQAMAPYLCFN